MKTATNYVLLAILFSACLFMPDFILAADNGLIIPMPDYKDNEKSSSKDDGNKTGQKNSSNKSDSDSSTLIPLPSNIKNRPSHSGNKNTSDSTKQENDTSSTDETPLITIEPVEQPEQNQNDFPEAPDEIVIEPDSLEPTENLPSENNYQNEPAASELPVFPKDTASAIFMVMKTWQCDDYNGNTLLAHAVDVYNKEAQENFQIKGLTEELKFNITLDEQDITLDELLDLISFKTGRDWGVDIQSQTIYFYPPGVTTDSLSAW
ncbi:MAG: hypothetical protein ACQETH_12910 [Candidatus Rifleibacteriota bacterium]